MPAAPRPNIVLILTDDQRWDSVGYMPIVMDRMVDEGLQFTNGFVPTPLCGPSRASILTGQYAHNTNVLWNSVLTFDASSTIATWLQDAGYATGMIGKYINLYGLRAPEPEPGWDTWTPFVRAGYFKYVMVEDGGFVPYASAESDYSTDVLRDKAIDFIEDNADRPFFLMMNAYAPHIDARAAPRHEGSYADLPPWRPPSYLERDISDKPGFIKWVKRVRLRDGLPGLAKHIVARDASHIEELETLLAVDEAIGAILDALEHHGLDQDTIVVFMSDNGLHWGEHWLGGKYNAYEESIRVPMVIRYPRMIQEGRDDERLVLNTDLAPTLAELAGIPIPEQVNGNSLVGALCDSEETWRDDFLLEYFIPRGLDAMPNYSGVRNEDFKYIIYASGFEELYDLNADPAELDNLLKTEADDPNHRERADEMRLRMFQLKLE